MKKVLCLLIFITFLTGCSIEKLEYKTYEDTVNKVLSYDIDLENVSLEGYKYYLPKGASLYNKNNTNSIIKYKNTKLYLYVDIVSYYHKEANVFKVSDDNYYSQEIKYKDKFGYLEITKIQNQYFVEFMYNYSKIEAYVSEKELYDTIYTIGTILSTINYNDIIINSLVGESGMNSFEESFDILKPKKEYTDYLEYDSNKIYDGYDENVPIEKDEDRIELNDNIE